MASRRRRRSFRRFKRRDREYVWATTADAILFREGALLIDSVSQVVTSPADIMASDLEHRRTHEITLLRTVGTLSLGWNAEQPIGTELEARTTPFSYAWYLAKFHGDESFDTDPDAEDVITTGAFGGTYTRRSDPVGANFMLTVGDIAGHTFERVDVTNKRKFSGQDLLAMVVTATDPRLVGDTETTHLGSQIILILRTLWLLT